jgi:hypothetical protein
MPFATIVSAKGEDMIAWAELDAASRRLAASFVVKLSFLLALIAALAAHGQRPLVDLARLMEIGLYMASFAAAVCAVLKRQKLQRRIFTHWDEALAFGTICLLVHVAIEVLG